MAGLTIKRTDKVLSSWKNELTHVPIPMAVSQWKKIDPGGGLWNSVTACTGRPPDLS